MELLCLIRDYNLPSALRQAMAWQQLVTKGTNQLIIDSYNASPASVQAALDTLLQLKVSYRIVILGDMADLGSQTTAWHNKILQQLSQANYDRIFLCGPFFTLAANQQSNPKITCFPDKEHLADYLSSHTFENTGILLKAAHHLAIHTLVEAIVISY